MGGYDLEMLEIRRILIKHSIELYDRKLKWGAVLSSYSDVFNDDDHFVGIELTEDVLPPKNYTRIDHHNDLIDNPSSIEQVANLLKIKLTRRQQIISANDKGYISGMIEMGATEKEILKIRRLDRKAQGVTEKDEKLAEFSILHQINKVDDLIIIESQTEKFSAITDRLFPYSKLLIFRENELVYYGEKADVVSSFYKELVNINKAFIGGKGPGFFGLVKDAFTLEEIKKIKTEIIHLLTD